MTSSYTDPKDELFALSLGADRYIRRPIEAEALIGIVEEVIEEHREGRAPLRPEVRKEEERYLAEYGERVFSQLERKIKELETEIARRKLAEKEQLEEVTFSNMLVDGLPGVFFLLDLEGRFVRWNKNLEILQELPPSEIAGTLAQAFIHEEDRHLLAEKMRETVQEGRATAEIRAILGSGEARHYVFTSNLFVRDEAKYIAGFGIDITGRKEAEEALINTNRALKTLSACNHTLAHSDSEEQLLRDMCNTIVEKGGYLLAWVGYAQQDEAKTLLPAAQHAVRPGYLDGIVISWGDGPAGYGPAGTAVRSGHKQIAQHIATDPRMAQWRDKALSYDYQSIIALPLHDNGGILGALAIYAAEPDAFDSEEVVLLEELAGDLAYGIKSLRTRVERDQAAERNRLYLDQISTNLAETIQAIAATVELRDPYTAGHEKRVAELSVAIGRELGMAKEQLDGLRIAGTVHDLGKIRIPAEILSKPLPLNELEYGLIKLHPEAGYEILKGINFPWPVATIVWQHHERLDGSGYPRGLKGGEILLEAQILAVADVVESILSHRPYRPALGLEAAFDELTDKRGKLYNADAVDACINLFREKGFAFP